MKDKGRKKVTTSAEIHHQQPETSSQSRQQTTPVLILGADGQSQQILAMPLLEQLTKLILRQDANINELPSTSSMMQSKEKTESQKPASKNDLRNKLTKTKDKNKEKEDEKEKRKKTTKTSCRPDEDKKRKKNDDKDDEEKHHGKRHSPSMEKSRRQETKEARTSTSKGKGHSTKSSKRSSLKNMIQQDETLYQELNLAAIYKQTDSDATPEYYGDSSDASSATSEDEEEEETGSEETDDQSNKKVSEKEIRPSSTKDHDETIVPEESSPSSHPHRSKAPAPHKLGNPDEDADKDANKDADKDADKTADKTGDKTAEKTAPKKAAGRPKYRFPSMDKPTDGITLKHQTGGPVCGGWADMTQYRSILKSVDRIHFNPKDVKDEISWFKDKLKQFIEIARYASDDKVHLYTYASVFINKSVRYHHTLTEMAKKEEYYTSFIHFTKEFMKLQWPNLAQRSMLIARTHKQDPKDSVEVYYEKHIDAHEDTGHPTRVLRRSSTASATTDSARWSDITTMEIGAPLSTSAT